MDPSQNPNIVHATTIISVRHGGRVAVAGDGQVTLGHTVMKGNARKVRRIAQGRCSHIGAFRRGPGDATVLNISSKYESSSHLFDRSVERRTRRQVADRRLTC